jgi:hypothetical protein
MDKSIFKPFLRQSSCAIWQGKKLQKYFNYFKMGIRVYWMTGKPKELFYFYVVSIIDTDFRDHSASLEKVTPL